MKKKSRLNLPWRMYVLRCKDNSLYAGVTNDLRRRVREHQQARGAKYTRGRTPVELVYFEPHKDRSSAQIAEASFKKLKKQQKEKLIACNDAFNLGSRCKPVNKEIFCEGELVRVVGQVHDPSLPDDRVGVIVEMKPNKDRNISDQADILFSNQAILKFHICHLEKIKME